MKKYILSLDQGTTSSRAILFEKDGRIASVSQREFTQYFPHESWVEHDANDIFKTQLAVAREAIEKIGAGFDEIYGIGITNQRETTILWDRATGEPIYHAIVWQCRRTAETCKTLADEGKSELIREKTGLLLDPYFSASKIAWILDNVPGAKERAKRGEIAFGTVDSWLIYNLTGKKVHATDVSNASRTMLFNIHTLSWDDELLALFDIPRAILPEVLPSSCIFGYTSEEVFGAKLAIGGVAGDQQAALFGQCCFAEGELKNTYGTGGFLLMNTGEKPYLTNSGLVTTVAWKIGEKTTYALEGSVFTCGASIQWLRDGLGILGSAKESELMAAAVEDSGGVFVVPAFTGLGAPWWDPYARGMIIGITRATTKNHVVRATLESLAYQTCDVISLMESSTGIRVESLNVDGGASANDLLLAIQSDLLGKTIVRPSCVETTALGAAYLCGLAVGAYSSLDEIRAQHAVERNFSPDKSGEWREKQIALWHRAVKRCLKFASDEE